MKFIERKMSHWTASHVGDISHELRVQRIASRLFDLTARRHKMDRKCRRLLMLAAIAHDVGRCKGADGHHVRGERMIRHASSLPLNKSDRRVVAFLTRYHRGSLPAPDDYISHALDSEGVEPLLALLRAADTLDSRKVLVSELAIRLRGRDLEVLCHIRKGWKRARRKFRRRRKFALLSTVTGIRTHVVVKRITNHAAAISN